MYIELRTYLGQRKMCPKLLVLLASNRGERQENKHPEYPGLYLEGAVEIRRYSCQDGMWENVSV